MKVYVTFGQGHTHSINDIVLDHNCVAVIDCESRSHGREKAFDYFGRKFSIEYFEDEWNRDDIKYYSRGYIEVL